MTTLIEDECKDEYDAAMKQNSKTLKKAAGNALANKAKGASGTVQFSLMKTYAILKERHICIKI
jgi:hypothetical protein